MNNKIITTAIIALLIGASITYVAVKPSDTELPVKTPSQSLTDDPQLSMPVIDAYYAGQEIWFIHTEVSDAQMAERLSSMVGGNNMMGMMATMHVPRLADIPRETAGKLYVFTNGVNQEGAKPWGGGPFGYQIDVFDSVPGQEKYTPLRNPYLVAWNDNASPRILKSVDEILTAESNGELTITQSEVIVNAPIVQWQDNMMQ
jgi:hypothetical protein